MSPMAGVVEVFGGGYGHFIFPRALLSGRAPGRLYFFPRRWRQNGHSLSLLTVPQTGQALGDSPSLRWAILHAPLIWAKFFCLRGFGASSDMAFRLVVDGFQCGTDEMRQT